MSPRSRVRIEDLTSRNHLRSQTPLPITMACPSCTFARTFAKRSAVPTATSRRTLHSTSAALQAPTADSAQSIPTEAPLLHVTKSKVTHRPHKPNDRAAALPHSTITRRLGIRYARPVLGAQEWSTSAYHYNKATLKTLPTARQVTDKLLSAYAVLQSNGGQGPSARTAIAARRKSSERVYMSRAGVKDFGSKVVVNAVLYDEAETQRKIRDSRERGREVRATGGGATGGTGAGRGGGRPGSGSGNAAAIGGRQ